MNHWRNGWPRGGNETGIEGKPVDLRLEQAIAGREINLLFQPQIEMLSGRVVGAEALARWGDEPSIEDLFARADLAGLGSELSRALQSDALAAAAAWDDPLASLKIAINLTAEDICTAGYDDWLLGEIARTGIAPERVTAEITENAIVVAEDGAADRLARLREAGVRIAVDDFGTGYASLAYLTRLPLDIIKIDRGLVANIVAGERDRIVFRALINLARDLGLQLVVEGVESVAQLCLLAEWGCDLYQGFIGAEPLTEDELARFVRACEAGAA